MSFVAPLRRRMRPIAAPTLVLAAGLSGCLATPGVGPSCPEVSILADAAELTQFAPGAPRDAGALAYQARIASLEGACTYDKKQTQVTVEITVAIAAALGPAGRAGAAPLTYFVAIVDQQKNIIAREEFNDAPALEPGGRRIAVEDALTQHIPLKSGEAGTSYRILVGFKLTEEQLALNRAGGGPQLGL